MYNKNDPLVDSVKAIMEQNELRRRVEAKLCEELGIYSRKQLPRERVANYDALLEQRVKEELVGNQHKIDANKNNRIDAHDFKLLRGKKESMKEEDRRSSDPDFAAPRAAGAPKYKDEIEYKEEPKATMPKNPPMPPRRPPNLEETSHMKKLDELSLDKMNAAKKEAEKRKKQADAGDSPVDKKYAERYGKYVELAKRRMKSKMDEEALEEKATPAQQEKVAKVMGEYKKGELHSGSKEGPVVTSGKQAVAIALKQAGISKKKVDEDFDFDAVMEEIRANLGEEAFAALMAERVTPADTSVVANPNYDRFNPPSPFRTSTQVPPSVAIAARSQQAASQRPAAPASPAAPPRPAPAPSPAARVPLPQQGTAERDNLNNQLNRTQTPTATQTQAASPFGNLTGARETMKAAPAPSVPSMAANAPRLSPSTFRGNTPSVTAQQALGNTSDARSSSYASRSPLSSQATGFSTDKTSTPSPAARTASSSATRPTATAPAAAPEPKSRQMFQAAQDRASSGENDSAAFFAADKQRTAELRGMQESNSLTSTINKILKG